jgi:hypothetical protein
MEKTNTLEKLGEKIGFIIMFFIFSTIFYFILKILEKIPNSWNYFHIMGLVFLITLIGIFINKMLK